MSFLRVLAAKVNKTETEVTQYLANAPLKYKVYTIPKRTSGHRVIAQPTKTLKEYQRAFLQLKSFPVHEVATAYCVGLSIKDNALKHKANSYLLKMDLKSFFNSINSKIFWGIWETHDDLPEEKDRDLIERLLFWSPSKSLQGKLILSVGAPSSPLLSNFIMYNFDESLFSACNRMGVTYTRYADDLTFSTNKKDLLFSLPNIVIKNLRTEFGNKITVNRKKTKFSSKAHNRHVTGITINNEQEISLGRKRKRYIKHLLHQFLLKKLTVDDITHLKGLLAFAKHIEPAFILSLEKKYSVAKIDEVFEAKNEQFQ